MFRRQDVNVARLPGGPTRRVTEHYLFDRSWQEN